MKTTIGTLLLCIGLGAACFAQQTPVVTVDHVDAMPPVRVPQLTYLFVNPALLSGDRFISEIDRIAAAHTFTTVFLTQREGANFYDYPRMTPVFRRVVAEAESKGLHVGLQLYSDESAPDPGHLQAVTEDGELTLDAEGAATLDAHEEHIRVESDRKPPLRREVLGVWLFAKVGDGEYRPGSLRKLSPSDYTATPEPTRISVSIHAGKQAAGMTAFVLTAHYLHHNDLFSGATSARFRDALEAYKQIGFRGAALDEFHGALLQLKDDEVLRQRWYSASMAEEYQRTYHEPLADAMFAARYAPQGDPTPRIRAVNRYFDLWRSGPLRIERAFAADAQRLFGADTFIGIHDTFHNALDNDEVWSTGINWWAIPRDYGQTDEHNPMPTRLGVALANPEAEEFNQFYSKSREAFYNETSTNLLYNTRTHYHAWNDTHPWGVDIGDPEMLPKIQRMETDVRLINAYRPGRPALDLLIVFGYPRQTNWLPDPADRNRWDIDGSLHAEETAATLWKQGILCALVPSYAIDDGKLTVTKDGKARIGGMDFRHVLFLGAEYSKPSTLSWLNSFAANGGKLLLDHPPTRGFDGAALTPAESVFLREAKISEPNLEAIRELGVLPARQPGAAVYQDGGVLLVSKDSMLTDVDTPFDFRLGAHHYSGVYRGVLALRADQAGNIEKLAGGHIASVSVDGRVAIRVSPAADVVLIKDRGASRATVVGQSRVEVIP